MALLLLNTVYEGMQHFYSRSEYTAKHKFYDTSTDSIVLLDDISGHKPFCYVDKVIKKHLRGLPFVEAEEVQLFNRLTFEIITKWKLKFADPLSIPKIAEKYGEGNVWEHHIPYVICDTADRELVHGMYYDEEFNPLPPRTDPSLFLDMFALAEKESEEFKKWLKYWIVWCLEPIPKFKRAAFDIEVQEMRNPYTNFPEVPNPHTAKQPVMSYSIWNDEGQGLVHSICDFCEIADCPKTATVRNQCYFNDIDGMIEREQKLIEQLFDVLEAYPIVLSFNGDGFDLKYLYNRARKLHFENIPIYLDKENFAHLRTAVHIDLMQFFQLQAVKNYMFKGKYHETGLDDVALGLIGIGKLERKEAISEMDDAELKAYNLRDAELTMKISQFDDDITMQLIILIMRICKTDIMYATRKGGWHWLLHFFTWLHRFEHCLIPNHAEILAKFPEAFTKSITKGKQFKGAKVFDTIPGVHWNVKMLDFSSNYPTNIKNYNIGYDTINCGHSECKKNKVPDLPHYFCGIYNSITALHIAILLFMRVKYFKPLSKKNILYKPIEQALKIIIIMSWGILSSESFPLSCPVLGECIVTPGRYKLDKIEQYIKQYSIPILLGDTDACGLSNPPQELIDSVIKYAEKELETEMMIDQEYRYLVLTDRKKNYFGIQQKDGKIDIKGLTVKKSNTPQIYKDVFVKMVKLLEAVQTPAEFEQAEDKIWSMLRGLKKRIQTHDVTLEELALHITLSASTDQYRKIIPMHVQAAKILESAYHVTLEPGRIVSFVKCKHANRKFVPTPLALKEDISTKKYLELLESVFSPIYEPFCRSDNTFREKVYGDKRMDGYLK